MRYAAMLIGTVLLIGCTVHAPGPTEHAYPDLIHVASPVAGAIVSSPVMVTGEARGPWYFEATFPFSVERADGTVLGQSYATAEGEWMTENFVPFSGEISLDVQEETDVAFIIRNANPSGMPENEKVMRIPVRIVP